MCNKLQVSDNIAHITSTSPMNMTICDSCYKPTYLTTCCCNCWITQNGFALYNVLADMYQLLQNLIACYYRSIMSSTMKPISDCRLLLPQLLLQFQKVMRGDTIRGMLLPPRTHSTLSAAPHLMNHNINAVPVFHANLHFCASEFLLLYKSTIS